MKASIEYGNLRRITKMAAAIVSSRPNAVAKDKWTEIDRIGPDSNFKITIDQDHLYIRSYCDLVLGEVRAQLNSSVVSNSNSHSFCVDARSFLAQVLTLNEDNDHLVQLEVLADKPRDLQIETTNFRGTIRTFQAVPAYFHEFVLTDDPNDEATKCFEKSPLLKALVLASTVYEERNAHTENFKVQKRRFAAPNQDFASVLGESEEFDYSLEIDPGSVDKLSEFLRASKAKTITVDGATVEGASYHRVTVEEGYIAAKSGAGASSRDIPSFRRHVPQTTIVVQASMLVPILNRARAFIPFNVKKEDRLFSLTANTAESRKAIQVRSLFKRSKSRNDIGHVASEEVFGNELGRVEGHSSSALVDSSIFQSLLVRMSDTLCDTVILGVFEPMLTLRNFHLSGDGVREYAAETIPSASADKVDEKSPEEAASGGQDKSDGATPQSFTRLPLELCVEMILPTNRSTKLASFTTDGGSPESNVAPGKSV